MRRFFWKRSKPEPVAVLIVDNSPLTRDDQKYKLMEPINIDDDELTLTQIMDQYPCPKDKSE